MTSERVPSPTRWWTLGTVSLGTLMLMFDVSVVAIALPEIRTDLDANFSELQWVIDAYALTLAVALIAAGSFADRIGRKKVFLVGFALFTAASLACGLAGDALSLNLSRGIQGIGAAVLFAVGPAMLGHEFHGKERAVAFSVFGASTGLGLALGPILGGGLTDGLGWEWIFFLNLPVGLFAIVFTALKSPESRNENAPRSDWAGIALLTVALSALVLAIIRGNGEGWASGQILSLFALAAVALVFLIAVERRLGEQAMFPFALFRNPTFVGISLVALFANAAGLPSVFIQTSYLQNVLGDSVWEAGLHLLPLTCALFFFGVIGGGLIGKVSFRALMGISSIATGVGLLLTNLADADSSWTAMLPALIVLGLGIGIFNPVRAALAIGVTEPEKAGVASGINETFQQVGISLGIAVVGALFENRVTSAFSESEPGQALGAELSEEAGAAISAGAVDEVSGGNPGVLQAAQDAFVDGFHASMVMCAVFAFIAAIAAVFLLRSQDLHSSALSPIPPDPDEVGAELAGEPEAPTPSHA